MRFAVFIPALCAVFTAASDASPDQQSLQVALHAVGNSKVAATITNTGSDGINVFSKGSLLDDTHAVDKMIVHTPDGVRAEFLGLQLRMAYRNLSIHHFVTLQPGDSKSVTVDLAELYNVRRSGRYRVQAASALPLANPGSSDMTGKAVSFSSNVLEMDIDGDEAAKVPPALKPLTSRSAIQSTCTGTRLRAVQVDLHNCAILAGVAGKEAIEGDASKFQEYFGTTSSSVRQTVAARFDAVAQDCATASGKTRTYRNDIYRACQQGVVAYALPAYNYISYCPFFFNSISVLPRSCTGNTVDQATTVLHEETHCPAVFSPPTDDFAYGYAASSRLTSAQAVLNADSYALYSVALYLGC